MVLPPEPPVLGTFEGARPSRRILHPKFSARPRVSFPERLFYLRFYGDTINYHANED
jgi:hypothetical protein